MKTTAGLLFVALLALSLAACGAPADEPAEKFAAYLDKHKKAIEEGKFDKAAFESEGAPLVAELKKHVDPTTKKIMLTESVLKRVEKARNDFDAAATKLAKEKGDSTAAASFYSMDEDLFGG